MLLKWTKWLIIGLLSAYILVNTLFYFFQEKIIFLDTQLDPGHTFYFENSFEEVYLKAEDGAILHGLVFTPTKKPNGTILYNHGNAGDVERWGSIVEPFVEKGYQVIVWDYRGYGKSTGTRSEATLYTDAQLFYDLAKTYTTEDEITIYGRSLGSGIATYLAGYNNPKRLLLETPYYSLQKIADANYAFLLSKVLLKYKIPSHQFMTKVDCGVTIFHGTNDSVIDYSQGKLLFNSIDHENKRFISLENGGHNNLTDFKEYWASIDQVLP